MPKDDVMAPRSIMYQCAKGEGYSIINGKRFDWRERDIFCVPSWMFHEHVNGSSSDDACLFSFHDLPVMRALNLYREEALLSRLKAAFIGSLIGIGAGAIAWQYFRSNR